jgi:hypothetical protein
MQTAKFVKEITVTDPDTKGKVKLEVYKANNGGMFAIDSSFLEQFDEDEICIFNPFADVEGVEENQVIVIKLEN